MKLTLLLMFLVCCLLMSITVIKAATTEKVVHHEEEDDDDDDMLGKDSGSKQILYVLWQSSKTGRRHVYKVIDKYLKKEDLDKKLLEIAKIIGQRFEKRMEYFAQKLDALLNYETS
ncbi:unnamed protein product [Trichobilharzia szidati]|nr:unnamed protein product [Trichobilharzia szidati]